MLATISRQFVGVRWAEVTKIRALVKCVSSFRGDSSELEKGRGIVPRWHPQPVFFESSTIRHYMCAKPKAGLSGQSTRTNKEASFTETLGGVPQSAVYTVPWGSQPAKNSLSNCHSPVGPRNASPPGNQSQVIKVHPLGISQNKCGSGCKNRAARHM